MKFAHIWIARIWYIFSPVLACALLLSARAEASSYAEYDGIQVMVQMDQETYKEGEEITAVITVVNTNSRPVTVLNLEQLIPQGYVLAENSDASLENVEISPGQEIVLQVTYTGEPASASADGNAGFWDRIFYGETWGIPNIILAVIVVIFLIIFMLLT